MGALTIFVLVVALIMVWTFRGLIALFLLAIFGSIIGSIAVASYRVYHRVRNLFKK